MAELAPARTPLSRSRASRGVGAAWARARARVGLRVRVRALLVGLVLLGPAACARDEAPLTVYAAASLSPYLPEVVEAWERGVLR